MSAVRLRRGPEEREVAVTADAAILDGRRIPFARVERDGSLAGIRIDGREHEVRVASDGRRLFVWCDGHAWTFEPATATRSAHARASEGDLISPMPGRVRRIFFPAGGRVSRGDVVLILEAMKMEHAIRAPRDGVLKLRVAEGDLVEAGVELAEVSGP